MSTLMRWNPTGEIQAMRRLMDRFFEDLNPEFESDTAQPFAAPAMDVVDEADKVLVRVDLPGFSPEDVNIEFKNGYLTIAANVNKENVKEDGSFTRRERYSGSYRRSLNISDSLDVQNADAHFENGVLTLTLPKRPEAQPVRIPIKDTKLIEGEAKK
ncbi:MAG TPA: Hsp20 family protein [Aggregatilineales bacterium]|nr:Hsp20 family protein [Aggregatilineales bacterium]